MAGAVPCRGWAFFEKLFRGKAGGISMAAPSVGRRSMLGKREAAALISQNRRWDMRSKRTKSTCPATVFFFPRRAEQAHFL